MKWSNRVFDFNNLSPWGRLFKARTLCLDWACSGGSGHEFVLELLTVDFCQRLPAGVAVWWRRTQQTIKTPGEATDGQRNLNVSRTDRIFTTDLIVQQRSFIRSNFNFPPFPNTHCRLFTRWKLNPTSLGKYFPWNCSSESTVCDVINKHWVSDHTCSQVLAPPSGARSNQSITFSSKLCDVAHLESGMK